MRSMTEDILEEARSLFVAGNYAAAEPLLQELLISAGRNPEVHQMLANIYYDRGQFSKAIASFKRALEVDPSYTDASVGLSILLNDLGRYDEGRRVFLEAQEMLERKDSSSDPFMDQKISSKHEELANLYFQCKRYPEGLEQLYRARALSTKKVDISLRIAGTLVQMGQQEKALREIKNLLAEYPQSIPARLQLGLLFYNMGQVAEAVDQWENVLLRDPLNSEAQRYLKMAQEAGITTVQP
ncbi:MAG: tetratricopeptide repeat protein [Bdellovibrionaceae bacterium]|nr:tetratricopeptide repeat protein [Pseudobdellovibrionaceae bacterium]